MAQKAKGKKQPPQHQSRQPGVESKMTPKPEAEAPHQIGTGKLDGKTAIITGGDSGIGRAVAIAFAKEGANIVISYLNEHDDAKETQSLVQKEGAECVLMPGDVGDEDVCKKIVDKAVKQFKRLDIVVNNAAEQHPQERLEDISKKQLERTFRTNIFSYFFLSKAALPHLKKGATIINTASVTAYRGSSHLLDYSSTKGAIVAFTRSLSQALADREIRVNGVAPGPVWTPLIPSTFPADQVEEFGQKVPMGRVGEPSEIAPSYVFLASEDSSYMTGQMLHPNGGEVING
jgi:NAD(P)-dependent dehydrogenase (short-subunit alcohol dehydrogenase family)